MLLTTGSSSLCQETGYPRDSKKEPVSWPAVEGLSGPPRVYSEEEYPNFFVCVPPQELCVYFTVISVLVELHDAFVPNAAVYPGNHHHHHHHHCLFLIISGGCRIFIEYLTFRKAFCPYDLFFW